MNHSTLPIDRHILDFLKKSGIYLRRASGCGSDFSILNCQWAALFDRISPKDDLGGDRYRV